MPLLFLACAKEQYPTGNCRQRAVIPKTKIQISFRLIARSSRILLLPWAEWISRATRFCDVCIVLPITSAVTVQTI